MENTFDTGLEMAVGEKLPDIMGNVTLAARDVSEDVLKRAKLIAKEVKPVVSSVTNNIDIYFIFNDLSRLVITV